MINSIKTKILISTKSFEELNLVKEKGVDIIDFKDPSKGSLGAIPINKINTFLKVIPEDQLTSATIGDIDDIEIIKKKVFLLAKTNVDFIKIGFFFNDKKIKLLKNLKKDIKNKKLIAVLFADNFPSLNLINIIRKNNFDGILIDTKNKKEGNLIDYLNLKYLEKFVKVSKKNNLTIGLAGSITEKHIKSLINLDPDFLGFRGALCLKKRNNNINEFLLNKLISEFKSFFLQKVV
ncbi:MAG: hypothetical protein CFH28_00831 [Alphaproteobacteria bacterium MarineAlpha6_Bin6]|nr:MAG: hypothetical protein CFH28_00831 [Alphaproteobacteria bacterium MarineAlpha6_Bin6]PPR32892.1 MAG: hypothetical protein CFH27_01006 [Alphaproteobacteria bacterium MarineAlpha6_Bin5]|tara:strand:+ start:3917 stop:4621 length:705 start_codon:yes stop_codon:yes gene_type:complete